MITCTSLLVLAIFGAQCGDTHLLEKQSGEGARQKRLLFYDEEGNLVKTYKNPYLQDLSLHVDKFPFYGNYLNPFFAFIKASYGGTLAAFAIPVSSEVVEQIQNDPVYQHKLVLVPKKDPVIAPNTLCDGKRAQVPSKTCNNFLNCWDGWSFEQECPDGLLFSREGFCDYAQNVDCSNREILIKPEAVLQPAQPQPQPPAPAKPQPSPQPKPPAQPSPPTQPQPQPQPAVPAQPTQPNPQPMPPCHQQIPAQTQQPHPQVPVSHPQVPLPQLPPNTQIHPMPVCSQDFESFGNRYNCNEFFVCVNRQPVKFQCPADLAYSQYLGVCDYPQRVECAGAVSSPSIPEPTLPPSPPIAASSKPAYNLLPTFTDYHSHKPIPPNIAMSSLDAIRQIQGI